MKIYIAGKITGLENYKELFKAAETRLLKEGHAVMNPSILPYGFDWDEYMHICYSMIDVCEAIYFLENWQGSLGARREHKYATQNGKILMFQNAGV